MKLLKPYSLTRVDKNIYLAFSKDYSRFDSILPILSNELKDKKVIGSVIIDMLLANGNNSSRFYEIQFTGESFDLKTIKEVTALQEPVLKKINQYIKKNPSILNEGVLTNNEIDKILAGI